MKTSMNKWHSAGKCLQKKKIFALTVRTYFHMLKREIEAVKICVKT